MKKEMEILLSGIGFYKLSAKNRKLLLTVLGISFAIHVLALVIFGSMIIMRHFREEKTVFEIPPTPMKSYEPRKLEHKVKVQKRQRSSSRPSVIPRMVAMKTADIALPEIKMDQKVVKTSFQPKFKAVQGTGMGVGLGTGYGLGGFGPGVSKFDFFGIQGKAEKIMLCLDCSISMVEDQRGGIKGYERVKARFNSVIESLSEGTLFNVVAFADAAQVMENKLIFANDENKKKAKAFIRPFNSSMSNLAITTGNVSDDPKGLPSQGGTTRLDLALTVAFQQGADTILIISDGHPRVFKAMTPDQMQAYNNMVQEFNAKHAAEIAKYDAEVEEVKVWVPPRPARPPGTKPLKEGEPPDRGEPAVEGHWEVRKVHKGGGKRPEPPKLEPQVWTLNDFLTHLKMLHEAYYLQKGMKPPVIHIIGYQMEKEGEEFLKGLCKAYHGKFRNVKTIK